jgi:hypothetical protein
MSGLPAEVLKRIANSKATQGTFPLAKIGTLDALTKEELIYLIDAVCFAGQLASDVMALEEKIEVLEQLRAGKGRHKIVLKRDAEYIRACNEGLQEEFKYLRDEIAQLEEEVKTWKRKAIYAAGEPIRQHAYGELAQQKTESPGG